MIMRKRNKMAFFSSSQHCIGAGGTCIYLYFKGLILEAQDYNILSLDVLKYYSFMLIASYFYNTSKTNIMKQIDISSLRMKTSETICTVFSIREQYIPANKRNCMQLTVYKHYVVISTPCCLYLYLYIQSWISFNIPRLP